MSNPISRYRFPDFSGKRVLYIGYENNDILAFALAEGVQEVIVTPGETEGNQALILSDELKQAPQVKLETGYLKALEVHKGSFDIIIFNSQVFAIDNAATLKAHWQPLIRRLSKNGMCFLNALVLESKPESDTEELREQNNLPALTRTELVESLKRCAWKNIHCINSDEAGLKLSHRTLDYIIQITRMKPLAYLLISEPGSGKSTILRKLFESQRKRIKMIKGDQTYARISANKLRKTEVPEALAQFVSDNFHRQHISKMTNKIFSQELHHELIQVWLQIAQGGDFVLDSYVPENHHQRLISALKDQGYEPVVLQTHIKPPLATRKEINARLEAFYQHHQPHHTANDNNGQKQTNNGIRKRITRKIKNLFQDPESSSNT